MAGTTELSLATIARVVDGRLDGAGEAMPLGYSIDSRSLRPGDLFFAIVGPNHDGHRFLGEAAGRRASGVVVSDASALGTAPSGAAPPPAIVVKDTLRALQDLAAFVRRDRGVKVVGVTGSSGKTTTKEMARQAIGAVFSVHASRGNLNNQYGCPLSILEIEARHQVSVLEMGMSTRGELARLAEIADPDIAILTNVGGAHLANFGSIDDVADAKGELFAGMRHDSIGIFNNDDEHSRRIMGSFKGYSFTYGIERPADLVGSDYKMRGLEGSCFEMKHKHNGTSKRVMVETQFVGIHNVYNTLAAIGAGYMLGIDLEAMTERLRDLLPVGMRGRVVRLGESVRVLDESYNSNPVAMKHALGVLGEARPEEGGRKIVVFGDMLELGETEVEAHRETARAIPASGAGVVVGVGPLAAGAMDALANGAGLAVHRFANSAGAAGFVAEMARPGDLVLVKGSRAVALEKIVSALRERFGEE